MALANCLLLLFNLPVSQWNSLMIAKEFLLYNHCNVAG